MFVKPLPRKQKCQEKKHCKHEALRTHLVLAYFSIGVIAFLSLRRPTYPDPLKDPKNGTPPKMNPLLYCGSYRIIRGFHFLDPLGGLGSSM